MNFDDIPRVVMFAIKRYQLKILPKDMDDFQQEAAMNFLKGCGEYKNAASVIRHTLFTYKKFKSRKTINFNHIEFDIGYMSNDVSLEVNDLVDHLLNNQDLTDIELEILNHLKDGKNVEEICSRLKIKVERFEQIKKSAFRKSKKCVEQEFPAHFQKSP